MGIGQELARHLADSGSDVYLLDIAGEEVAAAADELGATGLVCDVRSTADVDSAVTRAVADTGRVDIIVNNAGILSDHRLWRLSDEDWEEVLASHLGGTFRLTRAATPALRAQEYGRVINRTSYTGLHGNVG